MTDASAYQATAPIKAAEIGANQQKAKDLVQAHKPFARAVAHLNAQTERGHMAPKSSYDPVDIPPG